MNIFFLDACPKAAAQAHADTHVRKMIVETAQILSTAHRVLDGEEKIVRDAAGRRRKTYIFADEKKNGDYYKSTHVNHPSCVWARKSAENYLWLYDLFTCLLEEYEFRFGRIHATSGLRQQLELLPNNIESGVFSCPPATMADEYQVEGNAVESYRNYYRLAKADLLRYTKRKPPNWIDSN